MQYLTSLFLLVLSLSITAQTDPALYQPDENGVYEEAEQMPQFRADCPGDDYAEQKACSDEAMLQYVYDNISYPKEAKDAKTEGMVVISFIVEEDGTISTPEIIRDPGNGTGEEVLRIVNSMNANGPVWKPGLVDGKPVRVEFKLPVKFSLG